VRAGDQREVLGPGVRVGLLDHLGHQVVVGRQVADRVGAGGVAGQLSGVLAAVAGVVNTARLGASDPSFVGLLIELGAITAVVIGGTPLAGGRVRVLGTLMGALLMQLITATIIQNDLPDSVARMVQAAIIVVAVYVQRERGGS
jgi:ribose/xylose/arabinose/galactoside ABC-type transport system permease subunit